MLKIIQEKREEPNYKTLGDLDRGQTFRFLGSPEWYFMVTNAAVPRPYSPQNYRMCMLLGADHPGSVVPYGKARKVIEVDMEATVTSKLP